MSYKPRTDEDLKQVALGIISGTIFTSANVPESMVPMVFLPLGFMKKKDLNLMQKEDITLLYEEVSKAGPRAINGMPIFTSCHRLNRGDHTRLMEMIERLQAAIKNA